MLWYSRLLSLIHQLPRSPPPCSQGLSSSTGRASHRSCRGCGFDSHLSPGIFCLKKFKDLYRFDSPITVGLFPTCDLHFITFMYNIFLHVDSRKRLAALFHRCTYDHQGTWWSHAPIYMYILWTRTQTISRLCLCHTCDWRMSQNWVYPNNAHHKVWYILIMHTIYMVYHINVHPQAIRIKTNPLGIMSPCIYHLCIYVATYLYI